MIPSGRPCALTLSDYEVYDLSGILAEYRSLKAVEMKQAKEDEGAGKQPVIFDNWGDYMAGIAAQMEKASRLQNALQTVEDQVK